MGVIVMQGASTEQLLTIGDLFLFSARQRRRAAVAAAGTNGTFINKRCEIEQSCFFLAVQTICWKAKNGIELYIPLYTRNDFW